MSGATTWCVVYNGSEYVQIVDEEGHSVDPTMWACARRSFVRDQVDRGVLVLVDPSTIGPDSNPAARLAAEEAQKRNDMIDAEKEQVEADQKQAAKPKSSGKDK
jgi:hypothetical protein